MKEFLRKHSAGAVYGAIVGVVVTALLGDIVESGVDSIFDTLPELYLAFINDVSIAEGAVLISIVAVVASGLFRRHSGGRFFDPDVAVFVGTSVTMIAIIVFVAYSFMVGEDLNALFSEPINQIVFASLFLEAIVRRVSRVIELHKTPEFSVGLDDKDDDSQNPTP